jgi:hypothetical protein
MTNWMKLTESAMNSDRPAFAADHREAPENVIPLMNDAFRALNTEFELDFVTKEGQRQLFLYTSNSSDDKLPIRFNPLSYVHTFVDQVNAVLGRATGGDWMFEELAGGDDSYVYVFRSADQPVMPNEVQSILRTVLHTDR